jgi:regulator of RNase E activity RraA
LVGDVIAGIAVGCGYAGLVINGAVRGMVSAGVPLKVSLRSSVTRAVAITREVYGHVSPDVSRDALTGLSDALG